jgi:hypothetical protein
MWWVLLILFPLISCCEYAPMPISNMTRIEFHSNQMTITRTGYSVPTMFCREGNCSSITDLNCTNTAYGNPDHPFGVWECTSSVILHNVNCEGWAHRGDSVVLIGSCQVMYSVRGHVDTSPITDSMYYWDNYFQLSTIFIFIVCCGCCAGCGIVGIDLFIQSLNDYTTS